MIPLTESDGQSQGWQNSLSRSITDLGTLLSRLQLSEADLPETVLRDPRFPLKVPESFLRRIRSQDPNDPLLKQILPYQSETNPVSGYHLDPVGDLHANAQSSIIHKYHGRALLLTSGACAIHCRYCFRQHFPYQDNRLTDTHLSNALDYFRNTPSLSEVILSGGDPLIISDARLKSLIEQIDAIEHIKRVRIHTRLPVVLPDRVTGELINTLSQCRVKTVVVIHCNHPQEINQEVQDALAKFHRAGIHLLNQSVLLRGINDQTNTLVELSERLFSVNVLPYYLHLLDKVQGAAHFDVDELTASKLIGQATQRLPGYLVPKLVKEQAGRCSKSPITPLISK
ncbi:MAG: EF-P beta-lysylation protein EpmB [Gammaproteobacteria bacterium]|nr:MAG: EF-P beta-lysylation protein EpmB [Gammaproteobacteria bacterium]